MNPTPFELSQIAAALARNGEDDPAKLAPRALGIYYACAAELDRARRPAVETSQSAPPKPAPVRLKFPMRKDRFLRLVLPQLRGKTAEQGRIWRAFLAGHPPGSVNASFGSKWHDLGQCAANLWKNPIPDVEAFYPLAKIFGAWFADWQKEETSRQRSAAGKHGRKKRGARPPVAKLPGEDRQSKKLLVRAWQDIKREETVQKRS